MAIQNVKKIFECFNLTYMIKPSILQIQNLSWKGIKLLAQIPSAP